MERFFDRLGFLGLSMIGSGMIATQFVFVVDGGERAIIFNKFRGLGTKTYGEGFHWRIPYVMEPKRYSIRSRFRQITTTTGSNDLQQINLTLRVLFRPTEEVIPKLELTYGKDYDEKILPSIGNDVLKQVIAKYNAAELITQREKVSQQIRGILQSRATEFGLILDDVSITDLKFNNEF